MASQTKVKKGEIYLSIKYGLFEIIDDFDGKENKIKIYSNTHGEFVLNNYTYFFDAFDSKCILIKDEKTIKHFKKIKDYTELALDKCLKVLNNTIIDNVINSEKHYIYYAFGKVHITDKSIKVPKSLDVDILNIMNNYQTEDVNDDYCMYLIESLKSIN